MAFRKTDVVVLGSSSSGQFSVPFTEAFKRDPKYVAIVGNPQVPGIGMVGSPTIPTTTTLAGDPAGQIQVRVNSMTETEVRAEVLSNSLAPGQTSRISFTAQD
jgi:hypothetical protein